MEDGIMEVYVYIISLTKTCSPRKVLGKVLEVPVICKGDILKDIWRIYELEQR